MASSTRFDTSVKQHPSASQHAQPSAYSRQTLPDASSLKAPATSGPVGTKRGQQPNGGQSANKQMRASPVKHTNSSEGAVCRPELPSPAYAAALTQPQSRSDQQNAMASQLFTSSEEEIEDDFAGSDTYAMGEEEEGGDSDFEPAEQSVRAYHQLLAQNKDKGTAGGLVTDFYDIDPSSVLVGSQYTMEEASHLLLNHGVRGGADGTFTSHGSDDIAFKLAGEHEMYAGTGQSLTDLSSLVYRMREQQDRDQRFSETASPHESPQTKPQTKLEHNHYDTTNLQPGPSRRYSDNSSSGGSLISSPRQQSKTGAGIGQLAHPNTIKNKFVHKQPNTALRHLKETQGGQTSGSLPVAGSLSARQMIESNDEQSYSNRTPSALYETQQSSSNVRRFTRNISAYQSSFGKPRDDAQEERSADSSFQPPHYAKSKPHQRQDSSYSSEENEILLDSDFRSQKNYYNSGRPQDSSRDIEMKDLSGQKAKKTASGQQSWEQTQQHRTALSHQRQAATNLTKIKEQTYATVIQDQSNTHTWVDEDEDATGEANQESVTSKFKSTGVGFSPLSKVGGTASSGKKDSSGRVQVPNHVQQPGEQPQKIMTSFGWSKDSASGRTSGKDLTAAHEAELSQFERAAQLGHMAMMYPPKQIQQETWEAQNRNMQGGASVPTTQKEKRKKKSKDTGAESHFMLQGSLAQYLETRSYFRNSEDSLSKSKKQTQQASSDATNQKEALMEWFDSLALQDRVNACTTTFPILVASIIDAQIKYQKSGPLCLICIRKEKSSESMAPEMAQQRGRNRQGQPQETELIFDKCPMDDHYRTQSFAMVEMNQAISREFQTKIIKMSRITTNKTLYDTLTVTQDLVKDARTFFSIMENVSDGNAFSQPLQYVTRHGGKPIIQSPRWFDSKRSHYLGQWITVLIEETLWAHFNYARQVNISSGVRKQDLNSLFELRQENLHDQNDLANRWAELNDEGQQKLMAQLTQIAKEEQPAKFYSRYDEQERRVNQYHGDDLQYFASPRIGLYNFTEIPIMRHDSFKPVADLENPYFQRTNHACLDQQGHHFGNIVASTRNPMSYMQNDIDLREIHDILSYTQPLDLIKYLSEIPLTEIHQRNYARRHHLCLKLHEMIQNNLRQHIQDQLINEPLTSETPSQKSGASNLADNEADRKAKNKKKQDVRKNKRKTQQQTQTPQQATYQKKKQSISKSPPRTTEPAKVQQSTEPQLAKKPSAVEPLIESRVASTTTSEDQQLGLSETPRVLSAQATQPTVKSPEQQKAPSIQNAKTQQQRKKSEPLTQKKPMTKQSEPAAPLADESLIKAHVKKLLDDVVERVCQMESQTHQQSEQEPVKPTQTMEKPQKHQQPAVREERAEPPVRPEPQSTPQASSSKPTPQQQSSSTQQQDQPKKRRRTQKKKQDDQEKLNSFMRKYCGEADEAETSQSNKRGGGGGKDAGKQAASGKGSSVQQAGKSGINHVLESKKTQDGKQQVQQVSGQSKKTSGLQQSAAQYQNKGKLKDEPSTRSQPKKKGGKDDQSVIIEEPKPLMIPQANSSDEKGMQPLPVEEVKETRTGRKLGKIGETSTMFVFNIDSQPHLLAENLQQKQVETGKTVDEVSSHSQPLVQSSETQPSSIEGDREQQTQSAVQVEITIQQDSPRDTKSDCEPQREKISLTEHFAQAPSFQLNSFSDLREPLYQGTTLFDNSKIKMVEFPQSMIQAPQKQNFFSHVEEHLKWPTNQFKPQTESQSELAQHLSTTSVSFTPSSLQVSQQQSVVSDEPSLEMTTPGQQPDFVAALFSGFPQQMSKYNQMNSNQSPALLSNHFFPEQHTYQQKSSPPHHHAPHQQQFNTHPTSSGFQQQYSGQTRGNNPDSYQQKNTGSMFKKSSAPFRQQTGTNYQQPSQQQQMFVQAPHYGQKSNDMLGSGDFSGYKQFDGNQQQSRGTGRGHTSYKNKSDFLVEQPAFGGSITSFSGTSDQPSQIRLDAPSFEPVLSFAGGQTASEPQPELRRWNTHHVGQQAQNPFSEGRQQLGHEFQMMVQGNSQHPLYMMLEDRFYRQFDQNIEKESQHIIAQIARFEPERDYVLQKLQGMADSVFNGRTPKIKIFGSLMSGLALETSDMDLAVTGLKIDSREDMIDDLLSLGSMVQKWTLIKDYKAIETASIPVIKANIPIIEIQKEMGRKDDFADATFDLPIDITFDDSPQDGLPLPIPSLFHQSHSTKTPFGSSQEFQGANVQSSKMASNDPMTQIKNLITGELGLNLTPDPMFHHHVGMEFGGSPPQKTHLGLASCNLIKEYVRTYPHLRDVALLLKRFLSVHDLNQPYLGGISSYSAVLLIVAYMNHFKLHHSPYLTPSRLLMGFLDFYSNCFDPKHYGVDTTQGMSFFLLPRVNQQTFVIVDPVNPTNNTARNSFRTNDVLDHFRTAFLSLKNQIQVEFQAQLSLIETTDRHAVNEQVAAGKRDAARSNQSPGQQPKGERAAGDGQGQRSKHGGTGKKGNASSAQSEPPVVAKASEQKQPSSNQKGQPGTINSQSKGGVGGGQAQLSASAFPANMVSFLLSSEIFRKGGADKHRDNVSVLSGFGESTF